MSQDFSVNDMVLAMSDFDRQERFERKKKRYKKYKKGWERRFKKHKEK